MRILYDALILLDIYYDNDAGTAIQYWPSKFLITYAKFLARPLPRSFIFLLFAILQLLLLHDYTIIISC